MQCVKPGNVSGTASWVFSTWVFLRLTQISAPKYKHAPLSQGFFSPWSSCHMECLHTTSYFHAQECVFDDPFPSWPQIFTHLRTGNTAGTLPWECKEPVTSNFGPSLLAIFLRDRAKINVPSFSNWLTPPRTEQIGLETDMGHHSHIKNLWLPLRSPQGPGGMQSQSHS